MTETKAIHGADHRDELRVKIEAREKRIAERTLADEARDAAQTATAYVKEHPLQVVGGAIVLGLVIGAFTKPGRRAAVGAATGTASAVGDAASGAAKTVGKAAKKRGSAIGSLLADALIAYAIKLIDEALDGARAGQDKLEDLVCGQRKGERGKPRCGIRRWKRGGQDPRHWSTNAPPRQARRARSGGPGQRLTCLSHW
ncbi:MAG: hypothetical protein AAFY81_00265 [Pseudomonadota bacterium]